jgi:hypothetical protein
MSIVNSLLRRTHHRIGAFFNLLAVELASQTLATLAGVPMMSESPWIPILVSALFPFASILVGFILPETLEHSLQSDMTEDDHMRSSHALRVWSTPRLSTRLWNYLKNGAHNFMQSTNFLWHNANLILLLGVFFAANMSMQSMALILQYATNKFSWSYAKACYNPVLWFINSTVIGFH